MPIYEYRCAKCGDFDVMQRITEKPLRKCPTCKAKVAKLISNTAFQLKGTGWYVTDYAGKSKPSSQGKADGAAADKGAAGASEPAASSTSDSGKSGGSAAAKDGKSGTSGTTAPAAS